MPIVRGNPGVKAGKVEIFAFNDVDPAWIDCDGRALNVVDEPALFAAIGYTWGGAGAVFNVPNMVDDFVRGAGPGRPVGTREADEIRAHTHSLGTLRDNNDNINGFLPAGANFGNFGEYVTQATGGAETRPRNVAAKFRIKR